MDFWSRLFGAPYAPRKPVTKTPVNSQTRFTKFKLALLDVERICSNKRDLAREERLLGELQKLFERLAQIIRDETRAPVPHPCVQYAAKQNIFITVNRAAAVSFHEGCVHAAISLMAALVDSEEESFLTSTPFAKSLMRLVTRVITVGDVLLSMDTETFILELLFTISAKIRLQPEILPSWFSVTAKRLDFDDEKEKQTQISKDDFPLCYILVDRIYHDGRIGDFSRTGLLYIFEATGKSTALAQWIVETSDVCTLMASGLGALYSQLSRELSIVYPDSVLPATLALSDYTTTQPQATAESAFSERHISHMTTFLSYLAFWQDALEHCKSSEVRQALLDHFQILFLQQLLYPSILESSDTDGGSSVAVLSYLTAILDSLDHPSLTDNIMSYLMATPDSATITQEDQLTQSQTLARRQSLLELTATNGVDSLVEPTLFSLVDLLQNSLASNNSQTLFSALRLTSTIVSRRDTFALSMLKADMTSGGLPKRRPGCVQVEIDRYTALASSIHRCSMDSALERLTADAHATLLEAVSSEAASHRSQQYLISLEAGAYLPRMLNLMKTFFTNQIDVNLALSEALIAIAANLEIRLDNWLALPWNVEARTAPRRAQRPWQHYLEHEEEVSFEKVVRSLNTPEWPVRERPLLFASFEALIAQLDEVRKATPSLDSLITSRKNLLQAASIDATIDLPPSVPNSPGASPLGLLQNGARSPQPGNERRSVSPAARSESDVETAKATGLLSPGQIHQPPPVDAPATTDILMHNITFQDMTGDGNLLGRRHTASLNHVLTNAIVLQEFILEIVAILSARASLLGDGEVSFE